MLTEKLKVVNINIAECYKLLYHNNYQGKFESYKEDLVLLCAAMMVNKEEDFKKVVKMVQMKPEIKKLMEGLVRQMNHNENLVTEYKLWKDENERINASIISEVREKSLKEGKKEVIINMYNEGISIEIISKCANLTINEIEKIINDNHN